MYEPFLEGIWDPTVRQLGPRDAAQALLRAQLETDVERRQTATASFRARLRVAKYAGIPIVDLQRRTGAARQTVYDAVNTPAGDGLDDLSVLAMIASGAASTIDALASVTGASHERIRQAVSRLHAADYVNLLSGQSGVTQPVGFFTLTDKGLERLHIELDSERLRSSHEDAWTVFIAIEKRRESAIVAAAKQLLGDDLSYGVVDAAVAPTRMRGPELAVVVRAPDSREAVIIVNGLWTQLRQHVSDLPPTPEIVAWSPPRG
jgi:hypothetical protein